MVLDGAMNDLSRNSAPAIAEAYDFGKFGKIIDAGGGQGALLICPFCAAIPARPAWSLTCLA